MTSKKGFHLEDNLLAEASMFIQLCYTEWDKADQVESRLAEIKEQIARSGTYEHTYEELAYGAMLAWRNSNRCIGRLFWKNLHVIDKRTIATEEEIGKSLLEHIEYATNGGKIRPTITVFPQESDENSVQILNHQLLRYAGYKTEFGILGDPDSLAFTEYCQTLGWKGKGTNFDVLPLVVQINQNDPVLFNIPEELILEVPIRHPEYEWFKDLELKWYAVPIISSMRLEIGGVSYTAAPFNGWYMGTEIGARNLADENRYNLLPAIGEALGLQTNKASSLWKDKALVELNIAVLESFRNAGVTIVDHHTAAQQFKIFEGKEQEAGREVTGNWAWLIPPLSPAATHIFHQRYNNDIKKPNFFNRKSN